MVTLERLPTTIDPFRMAEAGREIQGRMGLEGMERLLPGLANSQAEVQVALRFGVDKEKVRFVTGRIQTTLQVLCQRCMQAVAVEIDKEVNLGIVARATDAEWLQPGYEPLIVETPVIPLAGLVEDEILLAMPMVAAHPAGSCQPAPILEDEAPVEATKENPFAVLARLKSTS